MRPIKLARSNLTMETGTIVSWLKQEGDSVEQDEALFEVESDKSVVEVPCFSAGILLKIVVHAGDEVPVDTVVAYMGQEGDVWTEEHSKVHTGAGVQNEPESIVATSADTKVDKLTSDQAVRLRVSPVARRLAAELGIDLSQVQGSGPNGRISLDDVENFAASAEKTGTSDSAAVPLVGIRKKVADRTLASYLQAPHIHLTLAVDMGHACEYRDSVNANDQSEPISVTDMIISAVCRASENNSDVLSEVTVAGIVQHRTANVGIAVATQQGLLVPVIPEAERLSLTEIAAARRELVQGARDGTLSADQLGRGTITISNLGMMGIDSFDPILYPGQVIILGIGTVKECAVVRNGQIAISKMMTVTAGCDHRVMDGAEAALFLGAFKNALEDVILE